MVDKRNYMRADHASACKETLPLNFNLNAILDEVHGPMQELATHLEGLIQAYIGDVIEASASEEDDRMMGLINENVLKFVHPEALAGIPDGENNVRGVFKRVISRFVLQAGVLHGIEHFSMYFWYSPLNLPQRIRRLYDPKRDLQDYSYAVDKQNGHFGHEMFTNYAANADNEWNWSSIRYGFADAQVEQRAQSFVEDVRTAINNYDRDILAPARKTLEDHGIAVNEDCVLSPKRVGCSICM